MKSVDIKALAEAVRGTAAEGWDTTIDQAVRALEQYAGEIERAEQRDENLKRAREQASSQMDSISEMVAALEFWSDDENQERLEELREERESSSFSSRVLSERAAGTALTWAPDCQLWESEYPDEAEELAELETAAGDYENEDDVRARIHEHPLSVEVREGWHSPFDTGADPEEFTILLGTGGPAVRIRGELGMHNEPSRAWLEYQDWGTPWTEYRGENFNQDTLLEYCRTFYFGE